MVLGLSEAELLATIVDVDHPENGVLFLHAYSQWADIATGDRGGDVISLVAYLGHRVTLRKRSANRGGWEIMDLDANPEKGRASRLEGFLYRGNNREKTGHVSGRRRW
jgi:hypothetical protein